jgi:hypothetical protein
VIAVFPSHSMSHTFAAQETVVALPTTKPLSMSFIDESS